MAAEVVGGDVIDEDESCEVDKELEGVVLELGDIAGAIKPSDVDEIPGELRLLPFSLLAPESYLTLSSWRVQTSFEWSTCICNQTELPTSWRSH